MAQEIQPGIYPMLYSFFDDEGGLRTDPFRIQVDVAIEGEAAGVAILGLGTEVAKLTPDERVDVLETVAGRIAGRKPLLVTVYGDTPSSQIDFASRAIQNGATALILQPPAEQLEDGPLTDFFSEIIASVDCPVGIQNAPEFLGFGLSSESLITLARNHENFAIAKLECTSVALQPVADALQTSVMVFNGRCGLELPDNLRAGAQGLIPGLESVDKTSEIFAAFVSGDQVRADRLYTDLLPALCFVMQGIPHFQTYGKLLAALRLGLEPGGARDPFLAPTEFGLTCAKRFAARLDRLSH